MLKGNFKTLKDYVSVLREFRQARPGAEEALAILDEALQVNLSISAIPNPKANSSTASETSPSQLEASEAKNDINNEVETAITETSEGEVTADEAAKNGKQRRAETNSSKLK